MNINRHIFGRVAEKAIAYLILVLVWFVQVRLMPLDYFAFLPIPIAVVTLIFYSYALIKNNVTAYFLYTLNSTMFFLLFGLYFWKMSIGLPPLLLASLSVGLLTTFVVPFTARNLSNTIYEMEQGFFTWIILVGLFTLLFIGVTFVSVTSSVFEKNNLSFVILVILGSIMCAVTLMAVHVNVHLFVKGVLIQWMRME